MIIQTHQLCKTYHNIQAVKNLDLSIEEGELYALLGVNGAGKTTTLKMLSCLIKPTDGQVEIDGIDLLQDSQKIKQIINISPQETAIAPLLSVEENLQFLREIYGFNQKTAKIKTKEMMEHLQLTPYAKQTAGTLSGGWQRRLSIAMALMSQPKILFLDEPTLGLDVIARRNLWDFIKQLKGQMTIILTTHYLEEAEALSDHIGIMNQGQLKIVGTSEELMQKAQTLSFEDAFLYFTQQGETL